MGVNQWDFNHSQSWLVYDIDIPTLMLQKNQMRHISKFWMILYLDSLRPMKLVQRVLCGWLGPLSKYVPCWPVLLVSKAQHPCWLIVMSGENSWVRHRVKPGLINPDWSTGVTRFTPKKTPLSRTFLKNSRRSSRRIMRPSRTRELSQRGFWVPQLGKAWILI